MLTLDNGKSHRLGLTRFDVADTNVIFQLHNDPEVMRFLNRGEPTPRHIIVAETMPLLMDFVADDVFGFWKVVDLNDVFLGWCSLRPSAFGADSIANTHAKQAQLGYRFCRENWGQGYCSEALQRLVKKCFETKAVQKIIATTYEENLASIRIMEKLGMTFSRSFKWDGSLSAGTTYQPQQDQWTGLDVEYALERKDWLAFNA